MKDITNIVKQALPIAIGVALGMLIYEQGKKIAAKAS